MAAMHAWIQATVNQDIAGLQRILHDELVYTHSAATTQTKAEVIKDVQEGRGPAGIELSDTTIRVYDNTALVKSMVMVRGRPRNPGQGQAGPRSGNPGSPGPGPLYIMHVLVKGPQGWQVVSRQATRPAPPPTAASPGAAVLSSHRAPADAEPTADPASGFWRGVEGIVTQSDYSGDRVPNHRTEVRSRWTDRHLYLLYAGQYEELNLKPDPSSSTETNRLWNWDVAEAFLGADFENIQRYKELQVSPQGEWVDLDIDRGTGSRGGGSAWNSGFQVKARIDAANKIWYGEMKIPFAAIAPWQPAAGRELRAGLFRIAGVEGNKKFISWQVTGGKTFHVPEKFGRLKLVE